MKQIKSVSGRPAHDPYEARLVKIVAEALGRGNDDCVGSTEDVVAALRDASIEDDCTACAGSGFDTFQQKDCPRCKGQGRVRILTVGVA